MNDRELDRLLRQSPPPAPRGPAVDFADQILARLPGMRFVIPGSHPGVRVMFLAAVLGILTAVGISLVRPLGQNPATTPPPSTLFQPAAVESLPAPVSAPPPP